MDTRELRNSLPQVDKRWNANNAQSWASYPPGLGLSTFLRFNQATANSIPGSGRTKSLAEINTTDDWFCIWYRTGTIGKQVLIQDLMDRVQSTDSGTQSTTGFPHGMHAKDILERLLLALNGDEDTAFEDLKALTTHKAMCLQALTICCSPAMDLVKAALKQIYNRMTDHEISQIAQIWRGADYQGREAVFHAASLFETIRNNHTTHWSMPAYLLKATLLLWSYSLLFGKPNVTGFTTEQEKPCSVTLGGANIHSDQVHDWIATGRGRVKLPSIADLFSWQGRRKLLEHSMSAMGDLKSWGVSKAYLQLLGRLKASEAASTPS
jgi:hypothetical protein